MNRYNNPTESEKRREAAVFDFFMGGFCALCLYAGAAIGLGYGDKSCLPANILKGVQEYVFGEEVTPETPTANGLLEKELQEQPKEDKQLDGLDTTIAGK